MASRGVKPIIFKLLHPFWRVIDFFTPKKPDYWAFCTHHLRSDQFTENQRAIFELIKSDASIYKIIFYRGQSANLYIENATNYRVVRHGSLTGFFLLLRCKVVFLTNSIAMEFSLRWADNQFSILKVSNKNRIIVNLWHGIALKRLFFTANEETFKYTTRVKHRTQERKHYAGLVASSDIDSYAMAAMFYPLNYQQIWLTGLPRNDFLTQAEALLPRYIQDSLEQIRQIKQDKKLIVYAPTYRQTSVSETAHYYQFTQAEIDTLKQLLREQNAVLGYRPHYFKNAEQYFNLDQFIDNELIFDVSQAVVPEYSALARELDVLVTDYSSVYIEALYLSKPVICFGYDIEHYRTQEDGLLYDMDLAFPGPVVKRFADVLTAIKEKLQANTQDIKREQVTAKQLFFKYDDAQNSKRVVERIFERLGGS